MKHCLIYMPQINKRRWKDMDELIEQIGDDIMAENEEIETGTPVTVSSDKDTTKIKVDWNEDGKTDLLMTIKSKWVQIGIGVVAILLLAYGKMHGWF